MMSKYFTGNFLADVRGRAYRRTLHGYRRVSDRVFALCHIFGFRFAPRIRDLADKRLYVSDPDREYGTLAPLVGGRIHLKLITAQEEEVLCLAASIRHGTLTASLIIRKLASYLSSQLDNINLSDFESSFVISSSTTKSRDPSAGDAKRVDHGL